MSIEDKKLSDQWRTPDDLFNILDKGGEYQGIKFDGFNFDIDLTANTSNSKCNHFCYDYLQSLTGSKDSNCMGTLYEDWDYQIVKKSAFMNPPYSNPKPFIEKAWEDSKYCKIVCLVKCDPSTQWWATFWDYYIKCDHSVKTFISEWVEPMSECLRCKNGEYSGPKPGCDYLFFPKRIKFDPPKQLIDSGQVWKHCIKCNLNFYEDSSIQVCELCEKTKLKWVQKCKACNGMKERFICQERSECRFCKGRGYNPLSGPAFSCALLIFDRRNV